MIVFILIPIGLIFELFRIMIRMCCRACEERQARQEMEGERQRLLAQQQQPTAVIIKQVASY